jgi:hypothetical protein
MSRADGTRSPWRPYHEQDELFTLLEQHLALFIAKPRKTGISTGSEFIDVLETMAADEEGNRIRTVFAIDTDDKTYEHCAQLADFAAQLEIEHDAKDQWITFPNGSEIVCITAGGKQPGRGGTIHRLHVTELPFWKDPKGNYQALRSSCIDRPRITIETTLDPRSKFCMDLWRGVDEDGRALGPEFHRHFWKVEHHIAYRLPRVERPTGADAFLDIDGHVVILTSEQWKFAQDEGFTRKDAAAWWLHHALPNLCAGDAVQLMHDYPQCERHLFQAAAGRVIKATPKVLEPIAVTVVPGVGGDQWRVHVYVPKEETSGQLLIGVDTAQARGVSRSVVVVVDKRSGRICASFASAHILEDDLAAIVQVLQHDYEYRDVRGNLTVPLALIEDNGIGTATVHQAQRRGVIFQTVTQRGDKHTTTTEECISAAKRAIEAGIGYGPRELAEECDELRREDDGSFVGRKDMIVAYGICMRRREVDGHAAVDPAAEKLRKDRGSFRAELRAYLRKKSASAARPKWGL